MFILHINSNLHYRDINLILPSKMKTLEEKQIIQVGEWLDEYRQSKKVVEHLKTEPIDSVRIYNGAGYNSFTNVEDVFTVRQALINRHEKIMSDIKIKINKL